MRPLNVVLFGSDQFSLTCFQKLYESPCLTSIHKTVTPPIRKSQNPIVPLRSFCVENGHDLDDAPNDKREMSTWVPDWLSNPKVPLDLALVVSFGYLIPPSVLSCFRYGGINVHPSLLPKYRGSAPIEHTILNGDTLTGVSVIGLHPTVFDAGKILNQCSMNISPQIKYSELHSILASKASDLLFNTLENFENCNANSKAQDKTMITRAPKLFKEMTNVNWEATCASQVDRLHRAYSLETLFRGKRFNLLDISLNSPSKAYRDKRPGSFIIDDNNMFVKCSDGWIQVHKLKMINKNPVGVREFVNGHHLERLEESELLFTHQTSTRRK